MVAKTPLQFVLPFKQLIRHPSTNKMPLWEFWDPAIYAKGLVGVSPTCASSNRPTDLSMTVEPAETANLPQALLGAVRGKVRVLTRVKTLRGERICTVQPTRGESTVSLEKQANKLTKTGSNATGGEKKLCQCHPFAKVPQHGAELSND